MYRPPKNSTRFRVKETTELLPFLLSKMGGMTKTSVKILLSHRQVQVNGIIQTRHDTPLQPDDIVIISNNKGNIELVHPKVKIIYEDKDMIVVDKREGILTVETYKNSNQTTVFSILKSYVRKQHPRNAIYVVHRLDKDTGGVLVFAKNPNMQHALRDNWHRLTKQKQYIAIVDGKPEKDNGTIVSWLTEDEKKLKVSSSPIDDGGKKSITHYKLLATVSTNTETDKEKTFSMLELQLTTGRTNQIRVQLASVKHPILGDKKYGFANTPDPLRRLALHAHILEFIHPFNGKPLLFESPVPQEFIRLMK